MTLPSSQSYPLLTLTLPSNLLLPIPSTQGPTDHISGSFAKQPTIEHTFRPDEKGVNAVIALVATAAALGGPWIVLAGLVSGQRDLGGLSVLSATVDLTSEPIMTPYRSPTLASSTPPGRSRSRS